MYADDRECIPECDLLPSVLGHSPCFLNLQISSLNSINFDQLCIFFSTVNKLIGAVS